ncbi:MAG TPA: 23S rRNA (uracil(1939)-C(5))-methyltransferase RlmD [Armatimonadota bacterium]|nr:23S rRNA (uracil(1939)-C(5))-methyltransferase RlmD [Armatimonadota bacterium]
MNASPVKVGDHVTLPLDSLAVGGETVGRHEGMAVFALFGCPGDTAEVEITEVARSFARGIVRRVVSPSPDRVETPCPHFGDCGGCQIQHISYQAQLRHKTAMVRDSLARIGGLTGVEVADAWGMENPWFYRNRAEYHAQMTSSGDVILGFSRHHTHEVIGLTECRLQHPLSERIRQAVVQLMARVAQSPVERAALLGVETLVSFASGKGIATLVCDGRPPFVESLAQGLVEQVPALAGVLAARRRGRTPHRSPGEVIVGEEHIVEEIGSGRYRVSADSFFQSSPAQAARAVELVKQWSEVGEGEVVLDLYSGVGTFLLPLAQSARRAIGVEESAAAVRDANANLRRWRAHNVKLWERKVERILPRWADQGRKADVVILDPPRKGCGPVVLAHVARLQPRRIVLVSCHPATLARDLKNLSEHGYACRRLQPIDMFPQTWHIETVAVCEGAQA